MNHIASRSIFPAATPLALAVLLCMTGCGTQTGVMVDANGRGPVRLDDHSQTLPTGTYEFRIAPMDTLTVDVHRSGKSPVVADFGDAVQIGLSLRQDSYLVAPGDALGLTLQSETPQEFTLIVRPDGFLTLPRIGEEIPVAGKTLEQVTQLATAKFAALSRRPQLAFQLVRSLEDNLTRLNATYELSRDGTILIPTLGSVTVIGLDADAIARAVQRLAQSVHRNAITASATITVAPVNTTVMQSPDVRRYYRETVKVSADGSIYIPVAGRFAAAGRTLSDLSTEVASRLSSQYRNPLDVYIGLGESATMAVYVMGEVRQPGRLIYVSDMTMLQVLASAGWVSDAGDLTRVRLVHRTGPGQVTVYTANLREVYDRGGRGFQDLRLSPSDMVVVPRTRVADADIAVDYYIRRLLPFNTAISYSFINGRQVNVP